MFIEIEALNGDKIFVSPSHVTSVGGARDEKGTPILNTSVLRISNGDTIVVKGIPSDVYAMLCGKSLLVN